MIRLDKYLADMGHRTRAEARDLIRKGKVSVDGQIVRRPETKIDQEQAEVLACGKELSYTEFEYYMLNKPAGVVSATADARERTVVELIKDRKRKDLFPVGRLDKDTEGLLLITNDGPLAHKLLAPKKHVDKTYFARVKGIVDETVVRQFAEGIDIGTGEPERTMPAVLEIIRADEVSEIRLTIQEGKYHQVKRMFQAAGMEVLYLKRERMGTLELDPALPVGAYRKLTETELEKLL